MKSRAELHGRFDSMVGIDGLPAGHQGLQTASTAKIRIELCPALKANLHLWNVALAQELCLFCMIGGSRSVPEYPRSDLSMRQLYSSLVSFLTRIASSSGKCPQILVWQLFRDEVHKTRINSQ